MPTSQKSITIRVSGELKNWVKDISSNSRNQTAIFSEALILYIRSYFYSPDIRLSDDSEAFISPVISLEMYSTLVDLPRYRFPDKDRTRVSVHVKRAIALYQLLFDKIGVYNLFEIDIRDERGVITLLEDLEIIISGKLCLTQQSH